MKLKLGLATLTAASVFAMAPAFGQAQGGQQQGGAQQAPNQILQQEQSGQKGGSLSVSPAVVRQIEQRLNDMGYSAGDIDGNWNQEAQTAMQNWQQAQGIEPTGNINLRSIQVLGIDVGAQQAASGGQQTGG